MVDINTLHCFHNSRLGEVFHMRNPTDGHSSDKDRSTGKRTIKFTMTEETYIEVLGMKATPSTTLSDLFSAVFSTYKALQNRIRKGAVVYFFENGKYIPFDLSYMDQPRQRQKSFRVIDGDKK